MGRKKKQDDSVFELLEAERTRCARVFERLQQELATLPVGSLGQRTVKRGGKDYSYTCVRFRRDGKVVFEHLSREKAAELAPLFERKKKLKKDLRVNQIRIQTLTRLLKRQHALAVLKLHGHEYLTDEEYAVVEKFLSGYGLKMWKK